MPLEIRAATMADFLRIVAILNSQIPEPITLEEYVRQDEARPQSEPFYRVVAESNSGEVAAFGLTTHHSSNRPGEWFIRVRVDEAFQGQGVGTALIRHLESFAREQGASRFESSIRDHDEKAQAWVRRHGFAIEQHLFESTLDLTRWDPAPFLNEVTTVKALGFRFATLAELTEGLNQDTAYLRYFDFFTPIAHDIPGNEDRPHTPFSEWYDWVKSDPEWKPEHVLLAVTSDGAWAAVAHIKRVASGALINDFTGVAREYRGRGLTLALKVEALNLARSLGAPYIRTNNLSVNPRILAVNRRLGYQPAPGHFLLAKTIS